MNRLEKELQRKAADDFNNNKPNIIIAYGNVGDYTHIFDTDNFVVLDSKLKVDDRIQDWGNLNIDEPPKESRHGQNNIFLKCVFNK